MGEKSAPYPTKNGQVSWVNLCEYKTLNRGKSLIQWQKVTRPSRCISNVVKWWTITADFRWGQTRDGLFLTSQNTALEHFTTVLIGDWCSFFLLRCSWDVRNKPKNGWRVTHQHWQSGPVIFTTAYWSKRSFAPNGSQLLFSTLKPHLRGLVTIYTSLRDTDRWWRKEK